MRVALTAQAGVFRTAGTVGHGGATGTLWYADPIHRAAMVFMTQTMPPTPGVWPALLKAIDGDAAKV